MAIKYNARIRGKYAKLAEAAEAQKCVFCDLRDKYIVDEKNGMVLTVNIFPYINGQLLIVPRRHIERFSDLTAKEWQTLRTMTNQALEKLDKKLKIKDAWLILRDGRTAGKTVKHLHWNIMPYDRKLNTWHFQKITLSPLEAAKLLRTRGIK